MPFTLFMRKFSQFVPQNVAQPVGLTGGANSIGPSGGGASITYTFDQPTVVSPALYLGAAVRVDVATGLWMTTLATTALQAEFYAFIVGITGTTYTVQFAGPVPAGTPLLTGLIPGTPYYLSDTVAGGISAVPPAVTGEVNLPVLWAMDNGNSVIKMSRGFIEGSGGGGGGGGSAPNNVATVTQNGNTFHLGDALYLMSDQTFALANARSLAAAQAEWVVTSIVTANSVFTIQQGGKIQGLITIDDQGAAILSGPIYYVSPIVGQEGKLTLNNPTTAGYYSKPFYVQEVASSNTGWLLDQRPEPSASSAPIFLGRLNYANNLSSTTILEDANGNTFDSYQIIVHPGVHQAGQLSGLRANSASNVPLSIGFQLYINGVWTTTLGTGASYVSGTNSSAGANTSTLWGNIVNGAGATPNSDRGLILFNTTRTVALTSGEGNLTCGQGFGDLNFNFICVDYFTIAPSGVGYTTVGWASVGDGSAVNPSGFRIVFGPDGVIDPLSVGYILVYGIPNS
jgi:hypothetical protein